MTNATLEICSNGALNLVQDLGRTGWMAHGVSQSGAMDVDALRIANALAGNAPDCAAIEITRFPFRALVLADTVLAWAGADSAVTIDGVALPPWWRASICAGQTVTIAPPRLGARVVLACAGGLDVPLVMDSRSTDLKGGFGGLDGRGLKRGDVLAAGSAGSAPSGSPHRFGVLPADRQSFFAELDSGTIALRAIAAAEYDCFTAEAQAAFEQAEYTVTADANRTGYRLDGTALHLIQPLELLSHGLVPGVVQVPPSGQPIIQLADANTCGGYPKIACVIAQDLWRVAQAPVGTRLRFALIEADAAIELLRTQQAQHQRLIATIHQQLARP